MIVLVHKYCPADTVGIVDPQVPVGTVVPLVEA